METHAHNSSRVSVPGQAKGPQPMFRCKRFFKTWIQACGLFTTEKPRFEFFGTLYISAVSSVEFASLATGSMAETDVSRAWFHIKMITEDETIS